MSGIFCATNYHMKVSIEKILFAELYEETEKELIVFMQRMWVVPVCYYMKRALELLIKF